MRRRAGMILAAAVASSGCTSVLGQLDGLPLRVGLDHSLVVEAVQRGVEIAFRLAGSLAVLLGFHCWYRATHGEPWIALLKDYLGGLVVCVTVLVAMRQGNGPAEWLLAAGTSLGEIFAPPNHALAVLTQIVEKYATILLRVIETPPDTAQLGFRFLEAWQYVMSWPVLALVIAINTTAIFLMRLVLQIAFVWLSAFYTMVGPMAAPFVLLPSTRPIFVGWLRTVASLALWPWLLALAERLAVAIPYSTWLGTDLYHGDVASGVTAILEGQIMFLALNIVFLFVYLGIPLASYLLVSGAGRPFRGALP